MNLVNNVGKATLLSVLVLASGSQYYLGSLSWTSRTFYFLDSRDLLEVLRDCLGRERGGSLGDPPGP